MKLAIIFPSMERGGAEEYVLTIARAALMRGWEVTVASPAANATQSLVSDLQQAGAQWRHLSIGRTATVFGRRPRFLVPWVEALHASHFFSHCRPDATLVVLPGPSACHGVLLAAALQHIPAAACLQLTPRAPYAPPPIWKHLLRWAASRVQQWISISDDNKKFVQEALGFPAEIIKVIYNGAPQIEQTPQYTRAELCGELNISRDRKVILTVARLGIQKAHAVLLDAIPQIIQKHPDAHFVWLGEGPLRAEMEEKIEARGLDSRVSLPGFTPHVSSWLHACDLFLLPTHYEGLPFSLVEAMSAGKPVAASAVNSIPFVLQDGDAGVLVPENSPEAWAEAVCHMLSHPADMAALGERARARAKAFSQDTMVAETLKLLEELSEGSAQ